MFALCVLSELLVCSLQDLWEVGDIYTHSGNPSACLTWSFDIKGFIFGFYIITVSHAILSRHLLVMPVLLSHTPLDTGLLPLNCLLESPAVELFRMTELKIQEARYRQSNSPLSSAINYDSRKRSDTPTRRRGL